MRRHRHLVQLSRDHHRALVLARRLRRASAAPERLAEVWLEAGRCFEAELDPHFRVEEATLLPALEEAGEAALASRTRAEHAELRALLAGPCQARAAERLGELLHDHVRFEEEQLFPRAEAVLSAQALAAVAAARAAA